jgi:hypothetical protein
VERLPRVSKRYNPPNSSVGEVAANRGVPETDLVQRTDTP